MINRSWKTDLKIRLGKQPQGAPLLDDLVDMMRDMLDLGLKDALERYRALLAVHADTFPG